MYGCVLCKVAFCPECFSLFHSIPDFDSEKENLVEKPGSSIEGRGAYLRGVLGVPAVTAGFGDCGRVEFLIQR